MSSQRKQTGWDQKEVQQAWIAGGPAGQAAGMPQGGLWYPGEGTFYWHSQEGPKTGTPAPLGVFRLTRQHEGGEEPRERSRDGTSWDWPLALNESSHLVRELRLPAASSAESACLS